MSALEAAVVIKSGQLMVLRLGLGDQSPAAQLEALRDKLRAAPGYFSGEPLVIDASLCSQSPDWKALMALLQSEGIAVLGVHGPETLQTEARKFCGLPALDLGHAPARVVDNMPAAEPVAAPAPGTPTAATEPAWRPTLLIDKPLRSGQRAYAAGSDLVVIEVVSHGAEIIADGHVHVYGPLRGKVMAGARGYTEARIWCTHFDPELVAIAGVYRTTDTPLPDNIRNRPTCVRLDGDRLVFEPLTL
jgi:septum site-determining protein MinC